jgi:hypothetical protein
VKAAHLYQDRLQGVSGEVYAAALHPCGFQQLDKTYHTIDPSSGGDDKHNSEDKCFYYVWMTRFSFERWRKTSPP